MGKEVKIGLTVIATLLVVLAVVLVRRMTHAPQLPGVRTAKRSVTKPLVGKQAPSRKTATLLPISAEGGQRGKSSAATPRAKGWQQTANRKTGASRSNALRTTQGARQNSSRQTASPGDRYATGQRSSSPSIYGDVSDTGQSPRRGYRQRATSSVVRSGDRSAPRRPTPNLYGEDVERWGGESATQTHQTFRRPYDDPSVQSEQAPTPPRQQRASAYPATQQRPVVNNASGQAVQRLPAGATSYSRHGASTVAIKEPVARRENTGKYYVEPGDSFWKIAQKIYGDGGYFKALQAYNRVRYPKPGKLDIGDEILTPRAGELQEKYAHLCPKKRKVKPGSPTITAAASSRLRPGRMYVVEEGDTLYDIARYELGAASRWPEIYELNQGRLGRDMDYLRPGTKLSLPASPTAAAEQFAEQPGTTIWK